MRTTMLAIATAAALGLASACGGTGLCNVSCACVAGRCDYSEELHGIDEGQCETAAEEASVDNQTCSYAFEAY